MTSNPQDQRRKPNGEFDFADKDNRDFEGALDVPVSSQDAETIEQSVPVNLLVVGDKIIHAGELVTVTGAPPAVNGTRVFEVVHAQQDWHQAETISLPTTGRVTQSFEGVGYLDRPGIDDPDEDDYAQIDSDTGRTARLIGRALDSVPPSDGRIGDDWVDPTKDAAALEEVRRQANIDRLKTFPIECLDQPTLSRIHGYLADALHDTREGWSDTSVAQAAPAQIAASIRAMPLDSLTATQARIAHDGLADDVTNALDLAFFGHASYGS